MVFQYALSLQFVALHAAHRFILWACSRIMIIILNSITLLWIYYYYMQRLSRPDADAKLLLALTWRSVHKFISQTWKRISSVAQNIELYCYEIELIVVCCSVRGRCTSRRRVRLVPNINSKEKVTKFYFTCIYAWSNILNFDHAGKVVKIV